MTVYATKINGAWTPILGTITIPNGYSYERKIGEGPETETLYGDLQISEEIVRAMPAAERNARRIYPVADVEPVAFGYKVPEGSELEIVDGLDGRPKYAWPVVAMTNAEIRAARHFELAAINRAHQEAPFAWDFGDTPGKNDKGVSTGAAGAQTLQMRQAPPNDDIRNWQSAHAAALTALVAGLPDAIQPIKTSDNVWVQTTAAQVIQVLVTGDGAQMPMFRRQQLILENFGRLKALIESAGSKAQILDVDLEEGWP